MTKRKAARRDLSAIVADLHVALRRETADIIAIGGLLTEAKAQLKHGQWLPWLRSNFSMTPRTAQKYLGAHRFAEKNELGSHLRLQPSALYLLAEPRSPFSPRAVKAILKATETKWIDDTEALAIAAKLKPGPKPNPDEPRPSDAAEAEAEALLDAPPPELPPAEPPPLLPRQEFLQSSFDQGVKLLRGVLTQPAAKFATANVSPDDLQSIADFLRQVAAAIKERAA